MMAHSPRSAIILQGTTRNGRGRLPAAVLAGAIAGGCASSSNIGAEPAEPASASAPAPAPAKQSKTRKQKGALFVWGRVRPFLVNSLAGVNS